MRGVPELPAPTASRLRPARWRDMRLVVGVLLVLVSVVVGARVVAAADDGIRVWAAARALGPGQPVEAGDLAPVTVRLADPSRYLGAETAPPVGYQVVRPVSQGELVPAAALVEPDAVSVRRVVVDVPASTVDGLRAGRQVDVYVVVAPTSAGPDAAATLPPPSRVLEDVTVAGLAQGSGGSGRRARRQASRCTSRSPMCPPVLAASTQGTVHLVQRVGGGRSGAVEAIRQ